jgi:hypothetical protein
LGYVRKAHWALWIGFLGAIADRYWPDLKVVGPNDLSNDGGDDEQHKTIPPLALLEPNTRPLPGPCVEYDITLEIVEQLANGEIAPQDLNKKQKSDRFDPDKSGGDRECGSTNDGVFSSRITFDPLQQRYNYG